MINIKCNFNRNWPSSFSLSHIINSCLFRQNLRKFKQGDNGQLAEKITAKRMKIKNVREGSTHCPATKLTRYFFDHETRLFASLDIRSVSV